MGTERQAAARFIFVVLLLDVLGIGLLIPVLPEIVREMVGGDRSVAASWYGPLAATFALAAFLASPVLGALSDRFGRRPVLLIALAGYAVDYVVMGLAPTLGWLFAARFVGGVTGGTISTAAAYLADISKPEDRARNFGIMGAAFGLGFIVGPAAGGLLGAIGPRVPFFAAAVIVALNALYGLFVLPESLPPERRRAFGWRDLNPLRPLVALARLPGAPGLVIALFVMALGQRGLESVWVLSTGYRFDWGELENGLVLTVVGVCSAFVQGWLVGRVVRRYGDVRVVLAGLSIAAVAHVGFALAPWASLFLALVPLATANGLAGPALQGRVAGLAPSDQQGAVQGALGALTALTSVLAPLLTNAVFAASTRGLAEGATFADRTDAIRAGLVSPGAPFLVSAALLGVATVAAGIGLRATPPAAHVGAPGH